VRCKFVAQLVPRRGGEEHEEDLPAGRRSVSQRSTILSGEIHYTINLKKIPAAQLCAFLSLKQNKLWLFVPQLSFLPSY